MSGTTKGRAWLDLPIAQSGTLGGVKINGNNLSIDASSGELSATDTVYTLPTASTSGKGGIVIGDCLVMDGTTCDLDRTISADSITVSGACSAGSYSGLPIGTTSQRGILSVGTGALAGLLVTSGVVYLDSTTSVTSGQGKFVTPGAVVTAIENAVSQVLSTTRLSVGTFELTANTDLNGSTPFITWDNSISNNNGITHNSGTAIPQNSLFNVIETGLYVFSIILPVRAVGSARTSLSADIVVYTGTPFSSRGSIFTTHPIGNTYCRGVEGATNKAEVCGTLTIQLQAGEQFEIRGRVMYSASQTAQV